MIVHSFRIHYRNPSGRAGKMFVVASDRKQAIAAAKAASPSVTKIVRAKRTATISAMQSGVAADQIERPTRKARTPRKAKSKPAAPATLAPAEALPAEPAPAKEPAGDRATGVTGAAF